MKKNNNVENTSPQSREICGSPYGSFIVINCNSSVAHLIDLSSCSEVTSFPISVSGRGGMAVSATGDIFVACNWDAGTVTAYQTSTGANLWQLTGIQIGHVSFAVDDSRVYAVRRLPTSYSCRVLNAQDGRMVDEMRGVREILESGTTGQTAVVSSSSSRYRLRVFSSGNQLTELVSSNIWMAVAFGNDLIAIFEGGGAIHFIDAGTGEVKERRDNLPDHSYTQAAYCVDLGRFVAIRGKKSVYKLEVVVFDEQLRAISIADISDFGWVTLCNHGRYVAGSRGAVFDVVRACVIRSSEWTLSH